MEFAMATKFRQPKIAQIEILCKKSRNFSHVYWGLRGSWIQICYMNFLRSHGNQISATSSQHPAKTALISVLYKILRNILFEE